VIHRNCYPHHGLFLKENQTRTKKEKSPLIFKQMSDDFSEAGFQEVSGGFE
jgi:hypothetical protein